MRPIALCLTLLVFIAGCETSTDPFIGFGGGGGVSQAEAAGNWSFTVHPTSTLACLGGSLPDGTALTAHLDVLTDGTLSGTTSFWQNPPTTVVRPLSGAIDLSSGFTDLSMASASGSTSVMELRGTMTSAGSFSGNLTDPLAGSLPVFGACTYTTTGTKG